MNFLFEAPKATCLPIVNSDKKIAVRRIYCVGQNYADHAKEMGSSVSQDAPFFFAKHPEDIVLSGASIDYPMGTDNLHYELELVVVIGQQLTNADSNAARKAIAGFAVGIDLTRRDLQQDLRTKGHPWMIAKSFKNAAVVSAVNTEVDISDIYQQSLVLKQNGNVKQHSSIGAMARKIEELIAYLSTLDTLHPGDLLFTGTPSGVGAIESGDVLEGSISSVGDITITFN